MQEASASHAKVKADRISVVIATYRRGGMLLETLRHLLELNPPPGEIVVVDQTESPEPEVAEELERLDAEGGIRWMRQSPPSIPRAMNAGLRAARGRVVLFFDDDVVPERDVVAVHLEAYAAHPEAWAVAGKVVQAGGGGPCRNPGAGRPGRRPSFLEEDQHFDFGGNTPGWVANMMACHVSVDRERALATGGFDERYLPPVSFRFETDFAKRLVAAGGRIWFEPRASILHLRAGGGGTRAQGGHMTSASPLHGAGAYLYILQWGRGWNRVWHLARRPFREVRTKFHLRHPWWIPVKFIGECRALALARRLYRGGPRLIVGKP